MKKFDKSKAANLEDVSKTSYHVYEDGHSYWGIPLYRYGETPLACTLDLHESTVEEKILWHHDQSKG